MSVPLLSLPICLEARGKEFHPHLEAFDFFFLRATLSGQLAFVLVKSPAITMTLCYRTGMESSCQPPPNLSSIEECICTNPRMWGEEGGKELGVQGFFLGFSVSSYRKLYVASQPLHNTRLIHQDRMAGPPRRTVPLWFQLSVAFTLSLLYMNKPSRPSLPSSFSSPDKYLLSTY